MSKLISRQLQHGHEEASIFNRGLLVLVYAFSFVVYVALFAAATYIMHNLTVPANKLWLLNLSCTTGMLFSSIGAVICIQRAFKHMMHD